MTTPVQPVQPVTAPPPILNASHTWALLFATFLGSIASAFAPKIQAAASAHPMTTILVGAATTAVASALPSVMPKP